MIELVYCAPSVPTQNEGVARVDGVEQIVAGACMKVPFASEELDATPRVSVHVVIA